MKKLLLGLILSLSASAATYLDKPQVQNYLGFKRQSSAPSSPASGWMNAYVLDSDGKLYLKNSAGTAKACTFSGDIVNADVAAGAAIAYSKLATLNTGQILAGNAGTPAAATVSGDATIGATGTLTIADDAVTNAKSANMAQSTIKGRAVSAGTGDPTDLTATQATAILDAFTGDSGSGGVKGLVPAPAAGDAAASKFLKADGTWAAGSGGGAGAFNIAILDTAANSWAQTKTNNADFESTAGDWAAYADAAATTPVDMTGGSPNTTCARDVSSTLNGTANLLITKSSGASRQGEGCSVLVNIPTAYRGKPLKVSFPFATTGTVNLSDFVAYAYDVTNASLLAPSATITALSGSSGVGHWQFVSQASTAQLRIGLHIAGTTDAAATVRIDDVKIELDLTQANVPMGNWIAYTPTVSGLGTITNTQCRYRRVGDSMDISCSGSAGTTAASAVRISLPSGYSIDTSKAMASNRPWVASTFACARSSTANIYNGGIPFVRNGSTTEVSVGGIGDGSSNNNLTEMNGNALCSSSGDFSLSASGIPISGWNSGGGTSPILSLSDWQSYTPTFTGFGTVRTSNMEYRRVGDTLELRGSFVSGTATATEARVSLPAGLTSIAMVAHPQKAGAWTQSVVLNGNGHVLIGNAVSYITFGYETGSSAGLTPQDGNGIIASGTRMSINAIGIPISGWTSVSSGTLTAPRSYAIDSGFIGYGSTDTKIVQFRDSQKNVGQGFTRSSDGTNGTKYTINNAGVYSIGFCAFGSGGQAIAITVDDSALTTNATSTTYAQGLRGLVTFASIQQCVFTTQFLTSGNIVRAKTDGGTLQDNTQTQFQITQVSN